MIYGVKRISKYLLGMDIAGRTLAVRADDTFIVSYPRSGNTWTRFLIANLLYSTQTVSFANIDRLIPDAEAHSSRYIKRIPSPRVIKSHEYFDHRYPRVIYIVRDPRDVALSYYDFSQKYGHIPGKFPLDRYISDFVHGRLNSAAWGTWAENVGTWVAARHGSPNFLLLRYEDLSKNAEQELARIAAFFGMNAGPATLRNAVQRSSADRMRELEKTQKDKLVATKDQRPDIPFIGSATSGKWKENLTFAAIEEIETAWGPLMVSCGYELTTPGADSVGTDSPP